MQKYFGLDIGSSSIKLLELNGNTVSVAAMVANPTGRLGVDLVPAEYTALGEAIKTMVVDNKIKNKKIALAIPESLVFTRILSFPYMSSPELATAIRFEIEQVIPYPIDKLEISWEVLFKPSKPDGNEKMRVLVVAVPMKVSSGYVGLMDSLGIEIVRIENELLSLARSVFIGKDSTEVDLVVDIGFSTTKMVICDTNQIYVNYVSPIAGMAFTKIISDVFKLPPAQAEEYKRAYGLDQTQFEGKLFLAVTPVLSTLVADMKKVIASYINSYPEKKIDRIILCGGGAFLKGLIQHLVEQTGLEVVTGNVFEKLKVDPKLAGLGGIYAVAGGLALNVE
jgi:type IV pilus assembly protein PilM